VSRNNDAHHHEFLQADFYLEDIFLIPHGTTFLTDGIGKSDGRPPLPAAVVCRTTAEPLGCARRSKIQMLPFAIAVQAPRGGARGFLIFRNSGAVCCAARRYGRSFPLPPSTREFVPGPTIPEPSPRFFGWSLLVGVLMVASVMVFRFWIG
jgi:hypothetical protein